MTLDVANKEIKIYKYDTKNFFWNDLIFGNCLFSAKCIKIIIGGDKVNNNQEIRFY